MITKKFLTKSGNTLILLTIVTALLSMFDITPYTFHLEILSSVFISAAIISYILSAFIKSRKRKEELKLLTGLKEYFSQYDTFRVSENVVIACDEEELNDLRNLNIYYNNDCICSIDDYLGFSKEEYKKIMSILKNLPKKQEFVDLNNNGINDADEDIYKAEYYIEEIKVFQKNVSNQEVSANLKIIIKKLEQIKHLENKYPNILPKLKKLYERYLPILISILANYSELTHTQSSNEELILTEEKLIKTITLVNEALESMKTSFIQNDILNITTDMSVLEMILKQDGLIDDEISLSNSKE